jgi:hypothetical protein
MYMGRILDAIREAGEDIAEHQLASLSPVEWEHVNLTGDYLWEETPPSMKLASDRFYSAFDLPTVYLCPVNVPAPICSIAGAAHPRAALS